MRSILFLLTMILPIVLWNSQAAAFSENGFYTGMTRDAAIALAKSRGLEVKELVPNSFMMGRGLDDPVNREVHGGVAFCHDLLVGYTLPIQDLDGRLIPDLEETLLRFGQPQRVRIVPATVFGGGYIRQVAIDWYLGDDRVEFTIVPEQKDQQGLKLLSERHISLYFASKSPCTGLSDW